jgi:hypothetical protein
VDGEKGSDLKARLSYRLETFGLCYEASASHISEARLGVLLLTTCNMFAYEACSDDETGGRRTCLNLQWGMK